MPPGASRPKPPGASRPKPPDPRVVRAVFGSDEILRAVFAQLPAVSRARLVGRVCRRWDRLLLEHVSFEGAPPGRTITAAALHFLLRRAGPAGPRSLDLSSPACERLAGEHVVSAIEAAAHASDDPLALQTLVAWRHDRHATDATNRAPAPDAGATLPLSAPPAGPAFSFDCVERLRAACPHLFRASCSLALAHIEDLELSLELLGAGGGRQRVVLDGYCMRETLRPGDAEALAAHIAAGEAIGAVEVVANAVGDAGARALARALAANTSVASLLLVDCGLGADAAEALASALACPHHALQPQGAEGGAAAGASPVGSDGTQGNPGVDTPGTPGGGPASPAVRTPGSAGSARPGSWGSRRSLLSRGGARLSSSGGSSRSGLHSGGGWPGPAFRRASSAGAAAAAGLASAFAGVTGNWALRALSLASNGDVGEVGARHLARALAGGCALASLDLTACRVGAAGARCLASALRDNLTLETLRLGLNDVYPEGAAAFADLLRVTSTLRHLDLHGNELGDDGAAELAEGLAENNSLLSLVLYDNDVGAAGARALAGALAVNVGLESLDLASCDVGEAGRAALEEAMGLHGRVVVSGPGRYRIVGVGGSAGEGAAAAGAGAGAGVLRAGERQRRRITEEADDPDDGGGEGSSLGSSLPSSGFLGSSSDDDDDGGGAGG